MARSRSIFMLGLDRVIRRVNRWRAEGRSGLEVRTVERALERLFGVSGRLAVYGSLAPGRENHHMLADLEGRWLHGYVRGSYEQSGWGSSIGYPALRWAPDGERIPVRVLVARGLPDRWAELDRFEGREYVRGLVPVLDESRLLCIANLYLAR